MTSISNSLESSSTTASNILPDSPNSPAIPIPNSTAQPNNNNPSNKRYRAQPPKTFQCRGYGDCKMVFSRSEHLARHVRKHTGERPFTCHCSKQFSRLDNLRQHAQTVHADKVEQNEALMRELSSLHAAMAAGKGRKRNNAAANAAAASSQRSPTSPTTPTVPSSDQQRLSPPHLAPHNRNLEYPGLAHPYPGSLPVMNNSNFNHLYNQSHDPHHLHHGQSASFRANSVESSSSQHSFHPQDFHAQSFPTSVSSHHHHSLHHHQHQQSFPSDGIYRQQQQQQLPSLSRGVDSFRARPDSPGSTTSGISPISAIPTLPTPPPPNAGFRESATGGGEDGGTGGTTGTGTPRTLDARNSQQHGSFPFQHYSQSHHSIVGGHGGHGQQSHHHHHSQHHGHGHYQQHQQQHQQHHDEYQRSISGSPIEERPFVTGTSMESTHGSSLRDGSPLGGHSVSAGSYGESGSILERQWGATSAAAAAAATGISATSAASANGGNGETAYATVSTAHGIDARGGSDGRSGTSSSGFVAESGYEEGVHQHHQHHHSFRNSHEHGPSFLGPGYSLPSLPSIVGSSGANGPFASSFVGSYGEGEFSLPYPFPVYCS